MSGLIPFNRKNSELARTNENTGLESFYNMLDDFFSDNWLQGRSLARDTFKIDITESEKEYLVEAELPGIKKEEIDLGIEDDNLCISVNRVEEINNDGKKDGKKKDVKNYIHRERRSVSMSRRIRLANAKLDKITAKLEEGVLSVTIPKAEKAEKSRKISIG